MSTIVDWILYSFGVSSLAAAGWMFFSGWMHRPHRERPTRTWLDRQDAAAQWVRSWWRARAFYNARRGRTADPSPRRSRVDHMEHSPIWQSFVAESDADAAQSLIWMMEVYR